VLFSLIFRIRSHFEIFLAEKTDNSIFLMNIKIQNTTVAPPYKQILYYHYPSYNHDFPPYYHILVWKLYLLVTKRPNSQKAKCFLGIL
jgi:hypothetical protein